MQPKKLLCASELNFFQLTGEIKKRNQSNSSIFTKNRWRRYFCIFQNQNKMEIQNTLFVVECTRAEILRRAKTARAKFALKNMSWNLPLNNCLIIQVGTISMNAVEIQLKLIICYISRKFKLSWRLHLRVYC